MLPTIENHVWVEIDERVMVANKSNILCYLSSRYRKFSYDIVHVKTLKPYRLFYPQSGSSGVSAKNKAKFKIPRSSTRAIAGGPGRPKYTQLAEKNWTWPSLINWMSNLNHHETEPQTRHLNWDNESLFNLSNSIKKLTLDANHSCG